MKKAPKQINNLEDLSITNIRYSDFREYGLLAVYNGWFVIVDKNEILYCADFTSKYYWEETPIYKEEIEQLIKKYNAVFFKEYKDAIQYLEDTSKLEKKELTQLIDSYKKDRVNNISKLKVKNEITTLQSKIKRYNSNIKYAEFEINKLTDWLNSNK